jgi:hypothetical protein
MQVQKMKVSQEDQSKSRPQRAQTLYNFGLCLWLLSFDENGMKELQRRASVTPIVNLLKEGELSTCCLFLGTLAASHPSGNTQHTLDAAARLCMRCIQH